MGNDLSLTFQPLAPVPTGVKLWGATDGNVINAVSANSETAGTLDINGPHPYRSGSSCLSSGGGDADSNAGTNASETYAEFRLIHRDEAKRFDAYAAAQQRTLTDSTRELLAARVLFRQCTLRAVQQGGDGLFASVSEALQEAYGSGDGGGGDSAHNESDTDGGGAGGSRMSRQHSQLLRSRVSSFADAEALVEASGKPTEGHGKKGSKAGNFVWTAHEVAFEGDDWDYTVGLHRDDVRRAFISETLQVFGLAPPPPLPSSASSSSRPPAGAQEDHYVRQLTIECNASSVVFSFLLWHPAQMTRAAATAAMQRSAYRSLWALYTARPYDPDATDGALTETTIHDVGFEGDDWAYVWESKREALVQAFTRDAAAALQLPRGAVADVHMTPAIDGIILGARVTHPVAQDVELVREQLAACAFAGVWALYAVRPADPSDWLETAQKVVFEGRRWAAVMAGRSDKVYAAARAEVARALRVDLSLVPRVSALVGDTDMTLIVVVRHSAQTELAHLRAAVAACQFGSVWDLYDAPCVSPDGSATGGATPRDRSIIRQDSSRGIGRGASGSVSMPESPAIGRSVTPRGWGSSTTGPPPLSSLFGAAKPPSAVVPVGFVVDPSVRLGRRLQDKVRRGAAGAAQQPPAEGDMAKAISLFVRRLWNAPESQRSGAAKLSFFLLDLSHNGLDDAAGPWIAERLADSAADVFAALRQGQEDLPLFVPSLQHVCLAGNLMSTTGLVRTLAALNRLAPEDTADRNGRNDFALHTYIRRVAARAPPVSTTQLTRAIDKDGGAATIATGIATAPPAATGAVGGHRSPRVPLLPFICHIDVRDNFYSGDDDARKMRDALYTQRNAVTDGLPLAQLLIADPNESVQLLEEPDEEEEVSKPQQQQHAQLPPPQPRGASTDLRSPDPVPASSAPILLPPPSRHENPSSSTPRRRYSSSGDEWQRQHQREQEQRYRTTPPPPSQSSQPRSTPPPALGASQQQQQQQQQQRRDDGAPTPTYQAWRQVPRSPISSRRGSTADNAHPTAAAGTPVPESPTAAARSNNSATRGHPDDAEKRSNSNNAVSRGRAPVRRGNQSAEAAKPTRQTAERGRLQPPPPRSSSAAAASGNRGAPSRASSRPPGTPGVDIPYFYKYVGRSRSQPKPLPQSSFSSPNESTNANNSNSNKSNSNSNSPYNSSSGGGGRGGGGGGTTSGSEVERGPRASRGGGNLSDPPPTISSRRTNPSYHSSSSNNTSPGSKN